MSASPTNTPSPERSSTRQFFPSAHTQPAGAEGERDIHQRKRDHIALCHQGEVGLAGDPALWGEVRLMHCAMPELMSSEVDVRATLLGHTLKAPLMITGMTGGPPEAGEINRAVARLCERLGLAFGVGSQRVMTRDPSSASTFKLRAHAPNALILANIGVNQARDLGLERVRALVDEIEADALAVHLNPAMELVQPCRDADSDFRGGYDTIARLVDALDGRVLVKECGCGLSPDVVRKLHGAGVRALDLSGVGGTSWVKLEAMRAAEGGASAADLASLGFTLADWGLPTGAATLLASDVRASLGAHTPSAPNHLTLVASGGVTNPLEAVKALALGADVVGLARPVLQALLNEGEEGAEAFLSALIEGIKRVFMLTGAQNIQSLREKPVVLGPQLEAWRRAV